MLPKVNYQYFISYLGLVPFIFIIINKYFLFTINEDISRQFIFHYSIIILVFIGATNWNLSRKISGLIIIYGFLPSLFAVVMIIFNLLNFTFNYLILSITIFFCVQLLIDYLYIYRSTQEKKPFISLRFPLTLLITICLILIIQ